MTGVDDAHIEAALDGVVEKGGVDGFAHVVIAAKRKGDIADAAADQRAGADFFDAADSLDKVERVGGVFLHAGGDGEDIGVEDNIVRGDTDFLCQNFVGALADAHLVVYFRRLALFVKGHHDDGSAIVAADLGLLYKICLALFERDRIDDALAL